VCIQKYSCKTLQDAALHCNTPQHTASNTLQHTATHPQHKQTFIPNIMPARALEVLSKLQHSATHCNTLQHTATHCNTTATKANFYVKYYASKSLGNTIKAATHRSTPQHTATHRNTLQHTATHCNTLQHTATQATLHSKHHASKGIASAIKTAPHFNTSATHRYTPVHTGTHRNTPQHTAAHATHHNILQHTATQANFQISCQQGRWKRHRNCNKLQDTAIHRNTPQHTTTHCTTPQHTASRHNTPQHAATHRSTSTPSFQTSCQQERWKCHQSHLHRHISLQKPLH